MTNTYITHTQWMGKPNKIEVREHKGKFSVWIQWEHVALSLSVEDASEFANQITRTVITHQIKEAA